MRLATYNVEWFDALFDNQGQLLNDGEWSARHNVTRAQQIEALGMVFTALDADGVMIIEAPDTNSKRSTTKALTTFAESFNLRCREVVTGFANDTQQEIAFLYDPDVLSVRHDPQGAGNTDAPGFDQVFEIDLDVDADRDEVRFSKPPLELVATAKSGATFRLIGAHLKSKAPHGARSRDEVMRISIANRRKQLAQAIWLRRRVEQHVSKGEATIVMGDLNDGPGLDEYENLFGRSSVEILLGEGAHALFDPHASQALGGRLNAHPTTSRFFLKDKKRYLQALLDYIMISRDLRSKNGEWCIWHPFDDPRCWALPELRQALLTASDHFPVTLDIDL
ncbi:endonuclease/exonuclease/phosphatase family protein [uncultured Pelagimonas sp.]|uniref:endonuclease/exonuclease/phosphatase family protein n=1 Tax=uncultured Pelagimonas sp. TaxID=1618102 RepID=UPI002623CADE|nr:endonuclease/exonuclease/phosphatase family protein [uncultured Pelagimonas sp.]